MPTSLGRQRRSGHGVRPQALGEGPERQGGEEKAGVGKGQRERILIILRVCVNRIMGLGNVLLLGAEAMEEALPRRMESTESNSESPLSCKGKLIYPERTNHSPRHVGSK